MTASKKNKTEQAPKHLVKILKSFNERETLAVLAKLEEIAEENKNEAKRYQDLNAEADNPDTFRGNAEYHSEKAYKAKKAYEAVVKRNYSNPNIWEFIDARSLMRIASPKLEVIGQTR